MRVTFLLLCLSSFLSAQANNQTDQDLPQATRTPVSPTAAETAILKEGVTLHDAERYSEAIAKYQEILHQNPANILAIHELAFSCYTTKNYDCAMQAARTGAEFKSPDLVFFYMMIANIYDDKGDAKQADSTYRFAVLQSPDNALLHFNYGVYLNGQHNPTQARQELESALRLNPDHPGSHLILGRVYEESGYRIPAILAYSRFLALEPNTRRSTATIQRLQKLITNSVTPGARPGNINITLQSDAPKDEGDFDGVDAAIAIGVAASTMEKKKQQTPFDNLAETYALIGETIANAKGGFAAMFYAPYFKRLTDRQLTEAFVAWAWQAAELEGAEKWQAKNSEKLTQLKSCCVNK